MTRDEMLVWAIKTAKEIVEREGVELALAARRLDEDAIQATSTLLATEIGRALMEAYEAGVGSKPQM